MDKYCYIEASND